MIGGMASIGNYRTSPARRRMSAAFQSKDQGGQSDVRAYHSNRNPFASDWYGYSGRGHFSNCWSSKMQTSARRLRINRSMEVHFQI